MKTITISAMWPIWEWAPQKRPHTRWMFTSYAVSLSFKHSSDRRTEIKSDWYTARWGREWNERWQPEAFLIEKEPAARALSRSLAMRPTMPPLCALWVLKIPVTGPISQSCRCEYDERELYDRWDAWMEWQAPHMSGGFLMPKTRVGGLAQRLAENQTLEATSSGGLAAEHLSRGTCG